MAGESLFDWHHFSGVTAHVVMHHFRRAMRAVGRLTITTAHMPILAQKCQLRAAPIEFGCIRSESIFVQDVGKIGKDWSRNHKTTAAPTTTPEKNKNVPEDLLRILVHNAFVEQILQELCRVF